MLCLSKVRDLQGQSQIAGSWDFRCVNAKNLLYANFFFYIYPTLENASYITMDTAEKKNTKL
jgi:hypothetical protein